ncbi:fused MFS/spermidine synthase [Motilimonas cestriensis]|uniref:Fused MFS/spermidine synthase n=1 Tax=Motilimonas cestriensis TaxID=2742685 RepID=A0ABS8W7Q1_9GAMM|nr:fused MFS/spermidine synthase [Motilimonas cestriensis]MCE2593839.1 fused MFS/spermidine synthase [Motilimonas cestriensis]
MSAQLLFQTQDSWGPIEVSEEGAIRKLSFGPGDEQSRQDKRHPHLPEHEYIQGMLLALLFKQPKNAMILGLGAGCLVSALHHAVPGIKITAVELRAAVIDIAKRFFRLPHGKKITLINDDAVIFIQQNQHKKVDLLFADIYHAEGVDHAQLRNDFLQHCRSQLKADGILVLNCWHEHSENHDFAAALRANFPYLYGCHVSSGNWIVFASQANIAIQLDQSKSAAQQLKQVSDIDLTRLLNQLKNIC